MSDIGMDLYIAYEDGYKAGYAEAERKKKCKPSTNYDRIISKSQEELAEFLIQDGDCPPERMYPDSCPTCDRVTPKVCYDCWLDWLKQEATNRD